LCGFRECFRRAAWGSAAKGCSRVHYSQQIRPDAGEGGLPVDAHHEAGGAAAQHLILVAQPGAQRAEFGVHLGLFDPRAHREWGRLRHLADAGQVIQTERGNWRAITPGGVA
jgi:hypothetical protein